MRIPLIEDNDDDVVLIRQMISASAGETFKLEVVDRVALGTEKLAKARPDAILLDLSLPDSSGLDTYEKLHAAAPD